MENVGRFPDNEAGRRMMDMLDMATLQKRQPWYIEELAGFVSSGLITAEQAEQVKPFVGQPARDAWDTPYAKAERAGVITPEQARTMGNVIFTRAHSGTALCSGTASNLFDSGEYHIAGESFSTELRDDNVMKVTNGAKLYLDAVKVEKDGMTTDHSEGSFTGLNAAVLAEGGSIYAENSTIVSHAIGGNNIFVHGENSYASLKNCLLDAYGEASNRCVYVSFGGKLEAEHCEFTSRGSISSTIATDTGGGSIILKNCLVKTLGGHCASLYSTGRIEAENCVTVAPETEGLIIVGGNSMMLKNTSVFSGQGQGLKMTAAMEENAGEFSMEAGSLTVCEGPVLRTEGASEFRLKHVAIANPSDIAVTCQKGFAPPGAAPQPEGRKCVHMVLEQQELHGAIQVDDTHSVKLELLDGSLYRGTFEGDTSDITVHLSADSIWQLTADTEITALINENAEGGNIQTNGHRLIVKA